MLRRLALLALAATLAGCGSQSSSRSPFLDSGAAGASGAAGQGAGGLGGAAGDGSAGGAVGGPCVDDGQCDDGLDCTTDGCDLALGRCRHEPAQSRCDDGVYCNGAEVCDAKRGCIAGEPVSCSDDDTCTIDTCVEATRSCAHAPRDADGDGDPPWNCGGGDCNDGNPDVSSLAPEICGNGVDDDCDGELDEDDCSSPRHDTCADALEITASGSYPMSLAAASSDYSASCAGSGGSFRDVVAALVVPEGPPVDIDVVATSTDPGLALAVSGTCGVASSELACSPTYVRQTGNVARVRARGLGPGAYPLAVFGLAGSEVLLRVEYLPAAPAPSNETCGTALPLEPGEPVLARLAGVARDLESACTSSAGELVYALTLSAAADVDLYATSADGLGTPSLSLRGGACAGLADERTCQSADNAHLFVRVSSPSTLYVSVSADAPSDVRVLARVGAPSSPSADELCDGAPPLEAGKSVNVSLAGHTDDISLGCLSGAADAAYRLDLTERSDVLLVERISSGDVGAVGLAPPECRVGGALSCGTSWASPVRAVARGVAPGSHRAVVESQYGSPVTLAAYTRPARPPVLVPFADTCETAIDIPADGGRFLGNTANASADYEAGCDLGGQPAGGAPDQMLRLKLSRPRRVVLDMKGSGYDTLLDVRRADTCPGTELAAACAAGYYQDKSFLSLLLPAGEYFVQVDGYRGGSGEWSLDVFVAEP
ncbi:MAG: putative metal-binding motif-containing protein [Sorangiineae bacterium]|nr:putative metal-binding motif-containing protein [Polyangiaceae bacterium]MEB2323463.1 putative metal-binding motif-containing protein [Sorangiineae bacterium]